MASAVSPLEDRRMLGIGLVMIAYAMFAVIDSSAKWLAASGMPTTQIIFVRYGVHLALIVGLFLPQMGTGLFRSSNLKLEILRGLSLLASTICNFLAVQFLPLTMTSAIAFTMPLILCALSVPILGEQVGWRRWTAIAVGFAGILIVVQPGTSGFHPAAILSLMGATASAIYYLLTRKLAGLDSAATQQFFAALVALSFMTPPAILGGWVWPSTGPDWLAFGLIGLAGMAGHQLSTVAHRFAPASTLAPFAYFQMVYMTISSWLIFSQPPHIWIYVGAPIVMGSGFFIWWRERKLGSRTVTEIGEVD